MKRILLSMLLASMGMTGFAKTWTVISDGFSFSPASITIQEGDSVNFDLASIHTALEVSQASWNANNNTPLPGFSTPFGGGLVLPAQLGVGMHWYVCMPHASSGMKGVIMVESATSISDQLSVSAITLFPNPSNGIFQIQISGVLSTTNINLEIVGLQGQLLYADRNLEQKDLREIDLSGFGQGIYFLKIYNGVKTYVRRMVVQ